MPGLYDNPDQETLHLKAMQALALETGPAYAPVRQVYAVERAQLQAAAHVTQFALPPSSRRARETLRKPAIPVRSQALSA